MIIWLVGKSASGKSTIGEVLYKQLKEKNPSTVYLDGDEMRQAIGEDLKFTIEDRYISEKRTSNLCKLLDNQNIDVVCPKLSNSPELRDWNRKNFRNYFEIYVKVDQHILEERDPKSIYQKYRKGTMNNVVGLDIPFIEPKNPDLIISNDGSKSAEEITNYIIKELNL